MSYYDPFLTTPTAKIRVRLSRVVAGAAARATEEQAAEPRGDTFLPTDLLDAMRAKVSPRRARERAMLKRDARRPAELESTSTDLVPTTPVAESWDFGADPMLWVRTRYGERALREKLFAEATPYRGPSAWFGRLFGRRSSEY